MNKYKITFGGDETLLEAKITKNLLTIKDCLFEAGLKHQYTIDRDNYYIIRYKFNNQLTEEKAKKLLKELSEINYEYM